MRHVTSTPNYSLYIAIKRETKNDGESHPSTNYKSRKRFGFCRNKKQKVVVFGELPPHWTNLQEHFENEDVDANEAYNPHNNQGKLENLDGGLPQKDLLPPSGLRQPSRIHVRS